MNFEPIRKFLLEPTKAELARDNARLKSWLLAALVGALFGWTLFLWSVLK